MIRPANNSTGTRAARAGVVVLAAMCAGALTTPAQAGSTQAGQLKQPVRDFTVTCAQPSDVSDFGAAVIQMTFKKRGLSNDDFYVVVPVNNESGLDAGDRISVDRKQKLATVTIPADGTTLTPAATVEVRLGGDVVQRIQVRAGCGVIDPAPSQGPGIGQITTDDATVTVPITNLNDVIDDVGVTLYPAGGNSGETRFLTLAPGEAGAVTFTDVTAGQYVVEAYGYTSFLQSDSEPFTVG